MGFDPKLLPWFGTINTANKICKLRPKITCLGLKTNWKIHILQKDYWVPTVCHALEIRDMIPS